jgi:Protein of unknown function (DUF2812)
VNARRVIKWWWVWNSEKIERYVEDMAQNGWRLSHASNTLVVLDFQESAPQKVRVCVDYQRKLTQEYTNVFEDAGWERFGRTPGWIMWRKAYQTERPEIYSDTQSLRERNRRVALTVLGVLLLQIPVLLVNINSIYSRVDSVVHRPLAIGVMSLYVLVAAALLYGLVRLALVNRKLGAM